MSEYRRIISRASARTAALVKWRAGWIATARPKQLPPAGAWDTWNVLAGRGFGKTRIGAEDIGYYAAAHPNVRCAVVAPTQSDVRSVCFEGESGLLSIIPSRFISSYNSQQLEIWLDNGSLIAGKSAEKPDRLRGPQWHRAWFDELAACLRLQETWDNLQLGLRLGTDPRTIITTTPRPIDFLRKAVKDPRVVTTTGSTFENSANLAASALAKYREVYGSTRKGQQELYAKILDSSDSALWKWSLIEKVRSAERPASFVRIVIAVDPAVTSEDESDETGIIVVGLDENGTVWVLEDLSGRYAPREWASLVWLAYQRLDADAIVAEVNQGGDLVESNVAAVVDDGFFNFKSVRAKRGKYLRAEPVAAYYERGKVRHAGHFPELERQMAEFVGSTSAKSPDRLDALVYGVGELALGSVQHAFW